MAWFASSLVLALPLPLCLFLLRATHSVSPSPLLWPCFALLADVATCARVCGRARVHHGLQCCVWCVDALHCSVEQHNSRWRFKSMHSSRHNHAAWKNQVTFPLV